MTLASMLAIGASALAAGVVNAIAGGGSLITFPTLVAAGLSPVTASLTNTVAMCPGYLGAALAQRADLAGQRRRVLWLAPFSALGGAAGALLLLCSGDRAFDLIVPFLILLATLLLALQDRIRALLLSPSRPSHSESWTAIPVFLSAVYGGYFGAGMGVMILAALAVILTDDLIRINALKQTVSLVVNLAAAAVFLFSSRISWPVALIMLGASLVGGALGGRLASHLPARRLRWLIITLGLALSALYFAKLFR